MQNPLSVIEKGDGFHGRMDTTVPADEPAAAPATLGAAAPAAAPAAPPMALGVAAPAAAPSFAFPSQTGDTACLLATPRGRAASDALASAPL